MGLALAVRRVSWPAMVALAVVAGVGQLVAGELVVLTDVGYAPVFFVLGAAPARLGATGRARGRGRSPRRSSRPRWAPGRRRQRSDRRVPDVRRHRLRGAGDAGRGRWLGPRLRAVAEPGPHHRAGAGRPGAGAHPDRCRHARPGRPHLGRRRRAGRRRPLRPRRARRRPQGGRGPRRDRGHRARLDRRPARPARRAALRGASNATRPRIARRRWWSGCAPPGWTCGSTTVGDVPASGLLAVAAQRLLAESLTNALKHGDLARPGRGRGGLASTATVSSCATGSGRLDGPARRLGTGHGLAGMRERVGVGRRHASRRAPTGETWLVAVALPEPAP